MPVLHVRGDATSEEPGGEVGPMGSSTRLAIVVLAAGAGTRMRSSTPKVLHPLAGLPLIAHVLDVAHALEPELVVTVVRHERDRVAEAVTQILPDCVIVDQDEIPGTGRAVEVGLTALPAGFAGTVVVLSGDVPLLEAEELRALVRAHHSAGNALTLLSAVRDDPAGFGRVVRDESGAFLRIVEERDASEQERALAEINAGVYVFDFAALAAALPALGTANAQGEKYLTDAAATIRSSGGRVDAVPVSDPWQVAGVNDRVQLSEVARELNARIVRRWQLAGVTVQDPATTWIDRNVSFGEDVTILPGSQVLGATTVASGAVIGPDTTLVDCEVGEGAVIKRSDAQLAVIGARATVGPFSYLRPGTELGEDGKIGAYVESKNARIAEGAKVPHLSYVGDVEIGPGSNIGAGTIVANYDGVSKHRSVVGAQVRIGSKTVLVSPVSVGDGAYTAAGAIIRKDVPPGALGMSVAAQRNVEGWTIEHRPDTPSAAAAQAAGDDADEESGD